MTRVRRYRRTRESTQRGQSLVEGAVLFPLLIFMAWGGISLDSYIQVQAQVDQAVSRAALVAARNTYDPCLPHDEPGAPIVSHGEPHGFQDVVDAFTGALTSPLVTGSTGTLTITCTSESGVAPQASVINTIVNPLTGGLPTTTGTSSIAPWGGWAPLTPGSWPGPCTSGAPPTPDGGCFAVWRGGLVTVSYTATISIESLRSTAR